MMVARRLSVPTRIAASPCVATCKSPGGRSQHVCMWRTHRIVPSCMDRGAPLGSSTFVPSVLTAALMADLRVSSPALPLGDSAGDPAGHFPRPSPGPSPGPSPARPRTMSGSLSSALAQPWPRREATADEDVHVAG